VVKGVTIPKGMVVEILVHSMHHDPDYWVEPETFNPDRYIAAKYSLVCVE